MPAVEALSGEIDLNDQRPFGSVKKGFTRFREGDLLFAKITPSMENGKIAVARGLKNGLGCGTTEFHVLRPSEAVAVDFLRYFVLRDAYRGEAKRHMSGAVGQQRVPKSFLASTEIPLAPLAEQRRIVSRIEELFSKIEAGERAIKQGRKDLKRYRKAVLKAAVTGALTEDWRAANPSTETGEALLTRILEERREAWEVAEIGKLKARGKVTPKTAAELSKLRARYKAPEAAVPPDELDVPDGWNWAALEELCLIKGGVTVDRKRAVTDPVTLPYLRVANVQAGRIDISEIKEITVSKMKAHDCALQAGDILLNEGGDLDKLGRGWVWYGQLNPCLHQNHVFRARPASPKVSPEFVSHYANALGQSFFMEKGKQSVNLASISLTAISRLPVPLPPYEEQLEIVSRVEEALSRADAAEATLDEQARAARALRQSILKAAFTGRLVPQDPNDEPARKLLKRVKARAQ
tara:strand:+ start:483 stop:1877 length:1395 start_codon:yes stop_codon:yes gene_type:complete